MATFYTDGGTLNNGQFGKQKSVVCVANKTGKPLLFEQIGDKTNNEAELEAVYQLLFKIPRKKYSILCDSQLAVNLINKTYHTKIDRLQIILQKIFSLNKSFSITWIPRDNNKAGWIIESKLGL